MIELPPELMRGLGILEPDGTIRPPRDMDEWSNSMLPDAISKRQVALDEVAGGKLSTVFLGTEHYGGMWFETMFFHPDLEDQGCFRYRTYEEAEQGHTALLEYAKAKGSLGGVGMLTDGGA